LRTWKKNDGEKIVERTGINQKGLGHQSKKSTTEKSILEKCKKVKGGGGPGVRGSKKVEARCGWEGKKKGKNRKPGGE